MYTYDISTVIPASGAGEERDIQIHSSSMYFFLKGRKEIYL
jgi:hypothetical protein